MYHSDTSPEIQKIYDQKIRELSEEQRFLRGISLTHFCRQLCLAGIQDKLPNLTPEEIKVQLFERIYGALFTPEEKERIRLFLSIKAG